MDDHPDDVKRAGVCLYLKKKLTLKVIDNSFIAERIACEITLQNEKVMLLSYIDHQVNLALSLMNFCLILISF